MHPKLIDIITNDVSNFLRLDEQDLFDLKVEYGLKYIDDRYPPSHWEESEIGSVLKRSAIFWNWWRELWAQRDRQLLRLCEKRHGYINYTYFLNGYIGEQRMTETRRVYPGEGWDFYTDFHYWRKITLYPNEVMINECMEENKHVTI